MNRRVATMSDVAVHVVNSAGAEVPAGTIRQVIETYRGVPAVRYHGRWERVWWDDGGPTIVVTSTGRNR